MSTLSNVETGRGQAKPPSVRVEPDTIPEAHSSKTGVSVRYVPDKNKSWYVFRAYDLAPIILLTNYIIPHHSKDSLPHTAEDVHRVHQNKR